jgi:TolA-binding protein
MTPFRPLLVALAFLAGCSMSDFRAAEEMVRDRKFYNAIENYLVFVQNHPNHRRAPEALLDVGNIQQMVLNEPEKAVGTYQKLVSSYPVSDTTLLAQRRLAELQKGHFQNYHQAIIEYEKLLHTQPHGKDSASYQFEIAQCYTLLRKYDQAAIEYKTLIEKYPNFERMDEVYFQLGNNAYIGGKYEEALAAYETVEKRYPSSSMRFQATFGAGSAYEELEEWGKAREKYNAVLKDYPSPGVVEIRLRGLEKRFAKKNKAGTPIQ